MKLLICVGFLVLSGCATRMRLAPLSDFEEQAQRDMERSPLIMAGDDFHADALKCARAGKIGSTARKECLSELDRRYRAKINLRYEYADPQRMRDGIDANRPQIDEQVPMQIPADEKEFRDLYAVRREIYIYEMVCKKNHYRIKAQREYAAYNNYVENHNARADQANRDFASTLNNLNMQSQLNRIEQNTAPRMIQIPTRANGYNSY